MAKETCEVRHRRVASAVGGCVLLAIASLAFGSHSAFAKPGAQLWLKRYKAGNRAADLATSPGGSKVFVTGSVPPRGKGTAHFPDYGTVAYRASTGKRLWARRYNGPGNRADKVKAIAVSPNGKRVYVTGNSDQGVDRSHFYGNKDYATVAYRASTGKRLWVKRYDGPTRGTDKAEAVEASGHKVIVTGSSDGGSTHRDYLTIAYRSASGKRLWTQRYDDPAHGNDSANGLGLSPDGSKVFVTGAGGPYRSYKDDYHTIAYDASTGLQLWSAHYDGPAHDYDAATALAPSPDGNSVFVTGTSAGGGATADDYATIGYSAATGNQLWVRRYDGDQHDNDFAAALGVSPNGSQLFVTGSSQTSPTGYTTVAYDPTTGDQQWVAQTEPAIDSHATGLAINPAGTRVSVTGWWDRGTRDYRDYATVSYRASTGSTVWRRRYAAAPGQKDLAQAIAATASRVFVTGTSDGRRGRTAWATLAYSAR